MGHRAPARRSDGWPVRSPIRPGPLESLLDSLLLAAGTLNRLILGKPLMGHFGLEVVQNLLRRVELVDGSTVILIPTGTPRQEARHRG
jgi:hypothetical protein